MKLAAAGARPGTQEVSQGLLRAIGWGVLLVVVAVVAIILAMWVRRRMLGEPSAREESIGGFTLGDLRRMRDEGKLTRKEYEESRRRIVEGAQRALAREAAQGGRDIPSPELPRTKDVDLIRDAER